MYSHATKKDGKISHNIENVPLTDSVGKKEDKLSLCIRESVVCEYSATHL